MIIILATDGTVSGEAAADAITKFSLMKGDQIKVISVIDMALPMSIDVYGGYIPDTSGLENAAREHATKVVAETAGRLAAYFGETGVEITTDILFGSPESRIVETAEDIKADLIVLGSHGYNTWERLLLGSVSDSVVHHAHCSVMVVRRPR
jgi:nucleotide-binding universal stress UspA family protein